MHHSETNPFPSPILSGSLLFENPPVIVPNVDWPLERDADERGVRFIRILTELTLSRSECVWRTPGSSMAVRTLGIAVRRMDTTASHNSRRMDRRRQPLTRHSFPWVWVCDGWDRNRTNRLISQHTGRSESAIFKLKVCPTGFWIWCVQTLYPRKNDSLAPEPPLRLQPEAQPRETLNQL